MKSQIIAAGAEAVIIKKASTIIKDRIIKSYRHPKLDEKLRKLRTRSETKLIEKSEKIIPAPKIISSSEKTKEIKMKFVNGKKLSEHLEKLDYEKICKQIGKNIAKLHDAGIIHGDLTTSNMIFSEKDNKIYFIDFGLGFQSHRIEDKAVDLHLIKQALEAKHHSIYEKAFAAVRNGYKLSKNYTKTIKQLEKVEKRGRYQAQY